MRAFMLAIAVAAVIALGAAYVLSSLPSSVNVAYTTGGARIGSTY